MRLRGLCIAAALVAIVSGTVWAQRTPTISRLTQADVDKIIPVLQAEGAASSAGWFDPRTARGMNKQEYVALKNALIIAKHDAADNARIRAIKDDLGASQLRDANVAIFRANAAKLDAALAKVKAEDCGPLCSPGVPAAGAKR